MSYLYRGAQCFCGCDSSDAPGSQHTCRRCHFAPPLFSMFEPLPTISTKAKIDHIINTGPLPAAETLEVVSVAKRADLKLRMHPHSTQIPEDWRQS